MKTFVEFFNGHSYAWMTPRSSESERERTNYFCTYFSWTKKWGYGLNFITLQNYKVYKKFRSWSVRSPKTNTCRNNLFACRFTCSRGHSCMLMAVEKPDPPVFSYKFQGIFNANAFSELAVHTESKMIIFPSGPPQGFTPFFFFFFK